LSGLSTMQQWRGLSEAEVLRRRAAGEGNLAVTSTSRTYWEIVRQNVFDFVNTILFVLGVTLAALGRPGDALVSVGIVLANSLVGVVQEVRTKRALDRIALLTRPTATVIRDGGEQSVDPSAVVRGDVLKVSSGDQVVVDGRVLTEGFVDFDESLLTGEASPVTKQAGSTVYSGSFCVSGQAYYEATAVGAASLANRLTTDARAFRREYTPLQREINLVIRVVLLIAAFLEILTVVDAAISRLPVVETVSMSVVVLGIVPNGLVLAIAVAYGAAAIRMSGQGILVGQANAIEALSHVDVLCLDKTGTLTTGRFQLAEVYPLGIALADLQHQLGAFAASVSAPNRTITAIRLAWPGSKVTGIAEMPFSSARRWSALVFDQPSLRGTYVLGAVEALESSLAPDLSRGDLIQAWTERGLRVLLLAVAPEPPGSNRAEVAVSLPANLVPLGLVGLADELRPEARQTLDAFAESGVQLKLISGDDPRTVAAVAHQVGLASGLAAVSGDSLSGRSEIEWESTVEVASIFGRVSPEQKRELIRALRRRGHDVAMIGDGVNDVLALKQANLGIALESGSPAARAVADLILLNDSFGALPRAVREGQRIRNGMHDILKLFLTRVLAIGLLLVGTGIVGTFPLGPKQNALLTLLTVGIPSVALAAWARPGPAAEPPALRRVFHFVFPAAVTLALVELGVHLLAYLSVEHGVISAIDEAAAGSPAVVIAQGAVTAVGILGGLLLVVFVQPPSAAWVGGDKLSGDWRPALLALGIGVVYGIIVVVPALRSFFGLPFLGSLAYLFLAFTTALWALAIRGLWRTRLFERYLGVDWD
jgi:cation-transporting P-type ATPase E